MYFSRDQNAIKNFRFYKKSTSAYYSDTIYVFFTRRECYLKKLQTPHEIAYSVFMTTKDSGHRYDLGLRSRSNIPMMDN